MQCPARAGQPCYRAIRIYTYLPIYVLGQAASSTHAWECVHASGCMQRVLQGGDTCKWVLQGGGPSALTAVRRMAYKASDSEGVSDGRTRLT